ncbi:MAG: YIP1 family protein [Desulfobacterota bacterium]|nr:YIP1 family protein [Thermodesulfobacteriota bacterium]
MNDVGGESREFEPSRFFESFFWVARELLLRPKPFFRQLPLNAPLRSPLLFLATTSFLTALFMANYRGVGFSVFVLLMGANIISALFSGLLLHAMVKRLTNPRAGIGTTLRIVCYASIVDLAAWIPVVGVVPYCYGLYLMFLGLQETHHLPPRQAALTLTAIIVVITTLVMSLVLIAPQSMQEGLKLLDPQQP